MTVFGLSAILMGLGIFLWGLLGGFRIVSYEKKKQVWLQVREVLVVLINTAIALAAYLLIKGVVDISVWMSSEAQAFLFLLVPLIFIGRALERYLGILPRHHPA